jgi:hypothetical protein
MTEYASAPRSYIKLELDNLLGKINWNNIEYETGQISTNTATRDAEGNITYTATMKGTEKSIDIEQFLPKQAKVTLNLYTDNFIWQPQLTWAEWEENNEENDNYIKPYLKIIYPVNSNHKYYLNINFKTETPLIGLRYNKFNLDIFSDGFNLKKAKSLGGAFTFNFKF